MLRTNSKKAREGIRAYIRENYNPDGYDEYSETDDISLIASNILHCFVDEKVVHDSRGLSEWELFLEWMSGLPSILHAEYFLRSARLILGDILEETEGERNRFTETQAEEMLTKLIWNELRRLIIWPVC